MNSVTKTILLFHLFLSVIVAVDVTCDNVNPMIQSDVACTCKTAPGTDIDWYLDDAFHSSCVLSTICAPQYSGYSFSINMTENVYMMTINSYDYSHCTKITCKDTYDSSIQQSTIPSSLVFDTTFPSSMTEPGSNNSNGIISVTTGCISGFLDVQYDWYIIVAGLEERYFVYDTNIIDTLDNSLCVNCDTDVNGQRTIGFEHSEASGSGTKTGLFKVSLYHVSTNFQLNLTSRYFYTVKVRSSLTENSCYCWCWFDKLCWCIIIIIIIFCIVGGLTLTSYIAALVIYCKPNLSNKLLKDLNYKNCRLFIPFFGLYLIIIYCKSDKVNPGTQQHLIYDKNSVTNNSFNMRGRPAASNGEREKKCAEVKEVKSDVAKPLPVTTSDGMLTTCRRKHQRTAGEDEICCDNCKETRKSHASHAYCLSDEEYICTSCLNKCHKQCVLLWNTGNIASKDHNLCCIEHYKMEDLKLEGVCQECKQFICSKCMKKHEMHICTRHQQLHETFSDGARITPNPQDLSSETKTCSGCRSQPIECLNVHSNIIVCADCFEKGKQPAKGRLNVNDIKDILRKGQTPCQIHGVLGKGRPLPVEVFCFVCNLYMCVECFKKHRRIYDYWRNNLEGNMFYCSYCKGDEMLPVVCFDLLSRGFKCANCFQFKRQTSETNSLPAEVSKAICEITGCADPFLCHEDLSTNGRMSCTAEVYCLVCKVIMCRNCFKRHQQEK